MANTASPSKGNDIDQRVLERWHEAREIHPDVRDLAERGGHHLQELIDALPDSEVELRLRLAQHLP